MSIHSNFKKRPILNLILVLITCAIFSAGITYGIMYFNMIEYVTGPFNFWLELFGVMYILFFIVYIFDYMLEATSKNYTIEEDEDLI